MANISDAWGEYHFNFSKTQLTTPALRKAWLEKLSDILMYCDSHRKEIVTYYTELRLNDLSDDDYAEETAVEFNGAGKWVYHNNINFFTNSETMSELYQHMLSAEGLVISIEYQDIEGGQYIHTCHEVEVKDGKVFHTEPSDAEWEDIYPKKYLEMGLGDAYEAVSYFLAEVDDLTEEQFEQVLEMDADDFENWRELVGFED